MKKILLLLLILGCTIIIKAQDSLTQYTGKYIFPEGSVVAEVDISIENGVLKSNSTSGTSTLTQLGVDSFLIVEYNGTAVFKRNEEKKVNAVHIEVAGFILDGKKQENGLWIFIAYYPPLNKELLMIRK
jgi:hypothetical protein